MAAHRRSSPPGTHVSGPTTSGKFFDCWIEQFCKVGLIAIDWEIFHLIAWSIFCTLVLLVHKLQGKKTALGSKLPHILAQRLPQGALQSLFIDHSYDITLEESVNVTFTNANFWGGGGHDFPLLSWNFGFRYWTSYMYVRWNKAVPSGYRNMFAPETSCPAFLLSCANIICNLCQSQN